MPSNHPLLCHPLPLSSIFLSIRVFFNESALSIRWPKNWRCSFSISPSNEYSGLISFRINWSPCSPGDSFLNCVQFKSINSSVLSLLYGPNFISIHEYWKKKKKKNKKKPKKTKNKKKHSFDYTDLFGQVMSLLFKMLSRFIIAFLPKRQCLLISWLQSLSAVILKLKKTKSFNVSIVSPSICHEVMGPDANLSFLNVKFYCGY